MCKLFDLKNNSSKFESACSYQIQYIFMGRIRITISDECGSETLHLEQLQSALESDLNTQCACEYELFIK